MNPEAWVGFGKALLAPASLSVAATRYLTGRNYRNINASIAFMIAGQREDRMGDLPGGCRARPWRGWPWDERHFGPADFRGRFIAANKDEQIKMLVRLGYAFSMEGRSACEAGTERVLEPAKLRWVNEAHHRIFAQCLRPA